LDSPVDDALRAAGSVTGRDIQRVVIDDDEWVAGQVAHGTPEFLARFLLGTFQAAREGRFAGVDPLLGELLGRNPRTVRDLLAERADEARTGGQLSTARELPLPFRQPGDLQVQASLQPLPGGRADRAVLEEPG
jgi:hypothetical protein